MSSVDIQKIPAVNAFPLNERNNMLVHQINNSEGKPIDFSSTYLEVELGLVNPDGSKYTNTKNLIVGDSGVAYQPSAPFRQSRLSNSSSGQVYQDLMFVNIIDNNISHYSQSENEMRSQNILGLGGKVEPATREVVSIFNNSYADANPVLKIGYSHLFPGSLGVSDAVPVGAGVIEHRCLLENQYNWLTKCVPEGFYTGEITFSETGITCNAVNTGATAIQAAAVGSLPAGFLTTGDEVVISGLLLTTPNTHLSVVRNVNVFTPDAGVTAGNFTFTTAISASNQLSAPQIYKTTNTNILSCVALSTTGATLTLKTAQVNSHLEVGTTVKVKGTSVDAYGQQSEFVEKTKVKTLTGSPTISAVEFEDALTVPTNGVLCNLYIEPLYTNLSDTTVEWQFLSSHVVCFKQNMKMKAQKMLVSAFESQNVGCQAGAGKFLFTYPVLPEVFNCYTLTPTDDNMMSQTQGFGSYLFTLNDKPLSSIYLEISKSTDRDNLQRVFNNSPVYRVKNLKPIKDSELVSETEVHLYSAKLYESMLNDEPEVLSGSDKRLRVELVPSIGLKTPLTQVYLFVEKWVELG
jgi:hypothetical protein